MPICASVYTWLEKSEAQSRLSRLSRKLQSGRLRLGSVGAVVGIVALQRHSEWRQQEVDVTSVTCSVFRSAAAPAQAQVGPPQHLPGFEQEPLSVAERAPVIPVDQLCVHLSRPWAEELAEMEKEYNQVEGTA